MSQNVLESGNSKKLQALDPDLPSLASRAAIELDNLRLKKNTKVDAVLQISNLIKKSFEEGDGSQKTTVDLGTVSVFWHALGSIPSTREKHVVSVKDLVQEAIKISNLGTSPQDQSDESQLILMRDFYLALSRSSAAFVQSLNDERTPHPFKF